MEDELLASWHWTVFMDEKLFDKYLRYEMG
jgi:hypothetical protein